MLNEQWPHALCSMLSQIHNPKLGTRQRGGIPKDKSEIRNRKVPSAYCLVPSYFNLAGVALDQDHLAFLE